MMKRRVLVIFLVLAMMMAFVLPTLAQEIVKGKIETLDKEMKKITIDGKEYSLSDEVVQVDVSVGDEVEASVEGGVIKELKKQSG